MRRSLKVNLKIGILAAFLTLGLNVTSASAQTFLYETSLDPNYTSVVAFSTPTRAATCYLAYESDNGAFEMGTVTTSGITRSRFDTENKYWSQISPFNFGNTSFYVQYSSMSGDFQVLQLGDDCISFNLILTGTLEKNLTHVVPLYTTNPNLIYLLTYNSASPLLQIYALETNPWHFQDIGQFTLGAGFTSLMPYYGNGNAYFIAYSANSGLAEFVEFTGFGPGVLNPTANWGTTWVDLVPALTTLEFLGYSRVDPGISNLYGVGVVDAISISPAGASQVKVNKPWDNNVSLFAPYYIPTLDFRHESRPGFISYYQGSGRTQVWVFDVIGEDHDGP